MADLPIDRLDDTQPPFTYVACDCFGHFDIKYKRGTVKRWCCIFVSLVSRAIHIEILHSMDTDSFIMAVERFRNDKGPLRILRCDRGGNFIGAENGTR